MGELLLLARGGGSVAATASEAARMLLLLPLVLALLGSARHAGGASVCDTANCGKGNCSETTVPLPPINYECHCDPGWSHALELIPFSPCIVPNCSFNSACLNLSLSQPPMPPKSTLDICSVVSCGAGGKCKAVGGPLSFSYSCECRPGYSNLLNLTMLPCVNCFLGDECHALGLGPPAPAPAPPGDHGPSPPGPSAPPSGTKGSVSSPSLLQPLLLTLVSVAVAAQAV